MVVSKGQDNEDDTQESRIDEHRRHLFLGQVIPLLRDGGPDKLVKDENKENHAHQESHRKIHLVKGSLGFGQKILQSQGTRAKNHTNQDGLGQSIVQACKDGRNQGQSQQPVCDSQKGLHGRTKIGKKCR